MKSFSTFFIFSSIFLLEEYTFPRKRGSKKMLDKGYCFCGTEKTKDRVHMKRKFEHNMRLRNVENADPEKRHLNEVLYAQDDLKEVFQIPLEEAQNKAYKREYNSYVDCAKERVKAVEEASGRKVRKDAVLEVEVVLTYSPQIGKNIDLDEWKKANVEWLKKYFGDDNLHSAVLHMDESTPHIHAIITPIDRSSGVPSFNAKRWFDGKVKMSKIQTDYAEEMKKFGLSRGEKNSRAKHQDLQKFYKALNNVTRTELPKRENFATEEEYRKEVERSFNDAKIRAFALEQSMKRLEDIDKTRELNNDFYRKIADNTIKQYKTKLDNLQKALDDTKLELEAKTQEFQIVSKKGQTLDRIQLAISEMKQNDPEKGEDFAAKLNELLVRGKQLQKKKEKEKSLEDIER